MWAEGVAVPTQRTSTSEAPMWAECVAVKWLKTEAKLLDIDSPRIARVVLVSWSINRRSDFSHHFNSWKPKRKFPWTSFVHRSCSPRGWPTGALIFLSVSPPVGVCYGRHHVGGDGAGGVRVWRVLGARAHLGLRDIRIHPLRKQLPGTKSSAFGQMWWCEKYHKFHYTNYVLYMMKALFVLWIMYYVSFTSCIMYYVSFTTCFIIIYTTCSKLHYMCVS